MRHAYLVATFDVSSGVPVFRGVDIKSEAAGQLTRSWRDPEIVVDLCNAMGGTFEEAILSLKNLAGSTPQYAWALAHLPQRAR